MEDSRPEDDLQPMDEDENLDELMKEVESTPATNDDNVVPEDEEAIKAKEIKQQRKKMLFEMRETQKASQAETAKDRLKFLLQQSEIFSHFIHDRSPKKSTTGTGKSTKRGRKNEKEEDDEIIKETIEDEQNQETRLVAQPTYINGKMRDYQLVGLNWLIKLYENGINGILADEMGLGKTLQTISFLGWLKGSKSVEGPYLVISPKSTLSNWMKEFERWCPSLKAIKFQGDKDARAKFVQEKLQPNQFNVCVTSYEIAIREKAALRKFSWKYIVIDEAHRIKNEGSVLSQVVRLFNSEYRLLLTGTPLQNNLHELWALLNFLLPDVFSSSDDFDKWFDLGKIKGKDSSCQDEKQAAEAQKEIVEKLHKILRPFLLRRLKSEVEKALPPKKEVKLFVGMSQMQKEWYQKILLKDIGAINGLTLGKREGKLRLLNVVMQLRKCCNHPYLFDGAEPEPFETGDHLMKNAGKMALLDKLLPKLKSNGSRVLLFSQMTRLLDILEDYLHFRGYKYCRIDGSTSADDRENAIERFNKEGSEIFVFLLSTRAGGLGLNLATADSVILYDSDWNPQMDLQAQDRAHRIGQTKPVTVFRLVTQGSLEEKIVERAEAKLQLDALVIQQGRLVEQSKSLSNDEMLAMIRFGADEIFRSKDSTITAEEIDEIIAKGELKNDQMKKNIDSLLNFSEPENSSLYQFEGVDYKELKNKSAIPLQFLEPSKRERKANNYGVDAYYRNVLKTGDSKKTTTKNPRLPSVHDFQFYPDRLHELIKKEQEAILKRHQLPGDEKETATTEIEDLTEEEQKEKEELLKSTGFPLWTKKEFNSFIHAISIYGKDALEDITREVQTKTIDEIKSYSEVFWKKYKKIADWQKIISVVDKGENKRKKFDGMSESLTKKVSTYQNPWKELKIPHVQQTSKGKFTEDEDRFLVCMTDKVGYGNWNLLKLEVRKNPQFQFDWFLKSRSALELSKRVDQLIRIIQREYGAPTEQLEDDQSKGEAKEEAKPPAKRRKGRQKATTPATKEPENPSQQKAE